jgi:hypothetical protein
MDNDSILSSENSMGDNSLSKREIDELKKKLKNEKMGRYLDTFVNMACTFAPQLNNMDS